MRFGLHLLLMVAVPFSVGCGDKPCETNDQCSLPALCLNRVCANPPPVADHEPCQHDAHCQGGACVFTADGGTCATTCASATDCASSKCAPTPDLRTDGARLRLTCGPEGGERYFAERCSTDTECRSGLCNDSHCTSPCGVCPADFTCTPTTLTRQGLPLDVGACGWWPVDHVIELGAVDTSATGTQPLSFTLPDGYGAFTVVLEDAEGKVPSVLKLTGPDGTVFIGAPRAVDGGSTDLARASPGAGTTTLLVPVSDDPRAVVRPGRYQLELASFDLDGYPLNPRQVAGRLERVAVVAKHPARGGVVDLTLHLAPETGLTDVDGGDPFVRGMLGRFEELMRAKVGVSLGQVAVKMLPSDAGADVGTLADSRALWARFGEATPRQRPINVMTVAKLGFAAGVSGNSPGAPGVYGRPTSGVTLQPLGSGARSTGTLLSHEVLHYLGLFHTSDAFFGADYLTDTPYCEDTTAGGCPDARNLMFPFFPTGDPLTITSGQAKVVEGSPWVYRWVHPGACGADTEVVGLTNPRWASGNTRGAPTKLQGACGGTGGEVVYLYRLEAAAQRLKVTATATDFTPVLYVRRATCSGNEVACVAAEANQAVATVDNPVAGAYFIVVDSASDGGVYDVDVTVTP